MSWIFTGLYTLGFIVLFLMPSMGVYADPLQALDEYNVVWDSPSQNMHGSMPLGNGDIGTNAWMEENGDLVFYISKTDSWGDNGRLLKVGRVRISLSPNPITNKTGFRQELDLKNGQMCIDIDGDNLTSLKMWVDANHPVIHITSHSQTPIKATAKLDLWRTHQITCEPEFSSPFKNDPAERKLTVEPDTVVKNCPEGIAWYHRNIKSVGPELTMTFQGLDDCPGFLSFTDSVASLPAT